MKANANKCHFVATTKSPMAPKKIAGTCYRNILSQKQFTSWENERRF